MLGPCVWLLFIFYVWAKILHRKIKRAETSAGFHAVAFEVLKKVFVGVLEFGSLNVGRRGRRGAVSERGTVSTVGTWRGLTQEELKLTRVYCFEGMKESGLGANIEMSDLERSGSSVPRYFSSECCSICIADYVVGEQIRVLPCGHAFHLDCIDEWLLDFVCPMSGIDGGADGGGSTVGNNESLVDRFVVATSLEAPLAQLVAPQPVVLTSSPATMGQVIRRRYGHRDCPICKAVISVNMQ
ncbi:UNVERIFIED_CONTAM: hypothetical protein HDU68_005010 [Siphonaria sp. JEL0065]|nr:hypothetical protein HDU68_005010 [Siphonaria sp. JEL0065]